MRQASSDFLRVLCYLYLTKKTRGLAESSTNRIHRSRTGGEGEEGVGRGGGLLSFPFLSFLSLFLLFSFFLLCPFLFLTF